MASESSTSNTAFEISRVFPAPLSRVWDAWRDTETFGRWWGPKGYAVRVVQHDFRPGGFFHYEMRFPDAPVMWGRFLFRAITEGRQIVWLNAFSNDSCGIERAPFSDVCPLEINNTVTFSEQGRATGLLLRAQAFGATQSERDYFAELCASGSLEEGYGGTLDQLEALLAGPPREA